MTDLTAATDLDTLTPDGLVLETLLTPHGRADPYPRYQRLRELAPIHHSDLGPLWFLTRWNDCNNVLRDQRFGKGDITTRPLAFFSTDVPAGQRRFMGNSMLFIDPPDHTRLRALVSRGFTPRRVQQLAGHIGELTDHILDEIPDHEPLDIMDALAFRLPVQVIGELVGVPPADRHQFRYTVRDAATALEAASSAEAVAAADTAMTTMADYFRDLIAQRRHHREPDLISSLIEARDGHDRLSEEELIATLMLLFAAGFETTTNLIGNGLLCLLRNPDQFDRLRQQPDLVPSAVEEMLRYESPVQLDARTALEPADINGQPIPTGDTVITILGAANRDPDQFTDPERFDITRHPNNPLSFAAGIHYCLGANLARLEGHIVFDRLTRRYNSIDWHDTTPDWRGTLILRGVNHLNVSLTPAR